MKPLELHIYEKHPDADAYRVGGFFSPYCLVSRDKKLTGAELAAEWWRQSNWQDTAHRRVDSYGPEPHLIESREREYERHRVIGRFATLPHASDGDYE